MDDVEPGSGHVRQLLLWVADRPRTYAEAMHAWRTSCPRLSAWEDALADDLIRVDARGVASHGQAVVRLTRKSAILLHGTANGFGASQPAIAASDHCEQPIDRRVFDLT